MDRLRAMTTATTTTTTTTTTMLMHRSFSILFAHTHRNTLSTRNSSSFLFLSFFFLFLLCVCVAFWIDEVQLWKRSRNWKIEKFDFLSIDWRLSCVFVCVWNFFFLLLFVRLSRTDTKTHNTSGDHTRTYILIFYIVLRSICNSLFRNSHNIYLFVLILLWSMIAKKMPQNGNKIWRKPKIVSFFLSLAWFFSFFFFWYVYSMLVHAVFVRFLPNNKMDFTLLCTLTVHDIYGLYTLSAISTKFLWNTSMATRKNNGGSHTRTHTHTHSFVLAHSVRTHSKRRRIIKWAASSWQHRLWWRCVVADRCIHVLVRFEPCSKCCVCVNSTFVGVWCSFFFLVSSRSSLVWQKEHG